MPRPSQRTRSKKRLQKALPGGRTATNYRMDKPAPLRCSICGQLLAGAPNPSFLKAKKLNRSRRRVWRMYGGQVCHKCLKSGLKKASRSL